MLPTLLSLYVVRVLSANTLLQKTTPTIPEILKMLDIFTCLLISIKDTILKKPLSQFY